MENLELERQLEEITNEFRGRRNLIRKNKESDEKIKVLEDQDIQESLNYLRICVKYNIFDLEATRRENAYFRKLLEDHGTI